jgi:L-ascorbate metabolism protein UlaG (beta-lactamase superfamily)
MDYLNDREKVDRAIFRDMAMTQEFYHPTIILLNVGGRACGQSHEVATTATGKYFKPQIIIRMHYASLPTLSTEAEVRAVFEKDKHVLFMRPGQKKTF